MTAGREVGDTGAVAGSPYAPPDDTGEALGLPPSRLTLTVGFGPGLFEDAEGRPRFGLDGQCPPALAQLPHFIGDALRPARSGGATSASRPAPTTRRSRCTQSAT